MLIVVEMFEPIKTISIRTNQSDDYVTILATVMYDRLFGTAVHSNYSSSVVLFHRCTLYFAGIDESDGEASFIVASPYDAIAFNASNTSDNDEMETATQFFLNFTCPDFGKPV